MTGPPGRDRSVEHAGDDRPRRRHRASSPERSALTLRDLDCRWMSQAKCATADHDLMFPNDASGVVAACEVCSECPVRQRCLDYALDNRIVHGVWGGTSERRRARILQERRAVRPGGRG